MQNPIPGLLVCTTTRNSSHLDPIEAPSHVNGMVHISISLDSVLYPREHVGQWHPKPLLYTRHVRLEVTKKSRIPLFCFKPTAAPNYAAPDCYRTRPTNPPAFLHSTASFSFSLHLVRDVVAGVLDGQHVLLPFYIGKVAIMILLL